jgi:hypothetical protein
MIVTRMFYIFKFSLEGTVNIRLQFSLTLQYSESIVFLPTGSRKRPFVRPSVRSFVLRRKRSNRLYVFHGTGKIRYSDFVAT